MQIKELIERLEPYDKDLEVVGILAWTEFFGPVTDVIPGVYRQDGDFVALRDYSQARTENAVYLLVGE